MKSLSIRYQTRTLGALTSWLDNQKIPSFGAMMLDMYPKERVQDCAYVPKQNLFDILNWFESGNHFIS